MTDHAIVGVPAVLAILTKGGINSATKALAIEYASKGIRVNAVTGFAHLAMSKSLGRRPRTTPAVSLQHFY
jgi:NAD(P)-dependent dehydrogenase (short-subunit alcohol dehydrogenase family)